VFDKRFGQKVAADDIQVGFMPSKEINYCEADKRETWKLKERSFLMPLHTLKSIPQSN